MRDYVKEINRDCVPVPAKLKAALNRFFACFPVASEIHVGCLILAGDHESTGAKICLMVEDSLLYYHLEGEYGWDIHTQFYNAFSKTGYYPEKANSCVICFYKD